MASVTIRLKGSDDVCYVPQGTVRHVRRRMALDNDIGLGLRALNASFAPILAVTPEGIQHGPSLAESEVMAPGNTYLLWEDEEAPARDVLLQRLLALQDLLEEEPISNPELRKCLRWHVALSIRVYELQMDLKKQESDGGFWSLLAVVCALLLAVAAVITPPDIMSGSRGTISFFLTVLGAVGAVVLALRQVWLHWAGLARHLRNCAFFGK
ncbi:hypothetical protein DFJ74DRAFT_697354 [Hyaloraphidium curvatum]|nr:hypothetical protein DFJ74DRAFT_697354 [Hyaloraphidium curvatum]